MPSRFARKRDGSFSVRLVPEEREILRGLPGRLRAVLAADAGDPAVRRLFPPAFLDDEEAATAFGALIHGDLVRQRDDAASVMADSIDAETLTEPQLTAWLAVVNDTRLILGAHLDLTEDGVPQRADEEAQEGFLLYRYLTTLATQMVKALSGVSEAGLLRDVLRRERLERGGS